MNAATPTLQQKDYALNLRKRVAELNLDYDPMRRAGYEAFVVHFNGLIVEANRAFADLIECPVDEVIGLNAFELYPPESVRIVLQKLREGSQEPYEVMGMTRKGRPFPVRIWGMNFRMGELAGRVIAVKALDTVGA